MRGTLNVAIFRTTLTLLLVVSWTAGFPGQQSPLHPAGGDAENTRRSAREVNNPRTAVQKMVDHINHGDTPLPAEISAWLTDVSAVGFAINSAETSSSLVPVFLFLDGHYEVYEDSVISAFLNPSIATPLRSGLRELIGRHWERPASRASALAVFDRSADNAVLRGQVALTLAQHGEAVGGRILDQYSDAPVEARYYYAKALALLRVTAAVPLLRADSQQPVNSALRDAALCSLIRLDSSSPATANIVNAAIASAKPVSPKDETARDIDREVIAMHAVMALAETGGRQSVERMLTMAADDALVIDVRLTALQALAPIVQDMSRVEKDELNALLSMLGDRAHHSRQISELDRQRIAARIARLQQLIGRP